MTEDLTTYTEVDPNSHISTTSTRSTGTAINRNETAYIYKDKGIDYFDGLNIDFTICTTELSANDILGVFGISNTLNHIGAFGVNDIRIAFYYPSGGAAGLYIIANNTDSLTISVNTVYYCTLLRSSGSSTINLYVYSDSNRTTLLKNMTISLGSASTKHRYIFGISSQNTSNNYGASGYVENINIKGFNLFGYGLFQSQRINGRLIL